MSETESTRLPGAVVRQLRSRAQKLEPVIKVGHAGASPALLKSLDDALTLHELVKIRLTDHKDQKKEVARQLADASRSHLVWLIGHCVVLYRERPKAAAAA
ncbi:MAG: YhbY family RNA-binding protein [Verrucomicrobia bacterium]|nr:MAG: YhbY family RNA-binding protein [Verrucomicrobiota bacterium]